MSLSDAKNRTVRETRIETSGFPGYAVGSVCGASGAPSGGATSVERLSIPTREEQANHPTAILSRNSILLLFFFSLFNISSMASTGGTPVSARRKMTTRLYSSG